jgi:hypothetical protein
MDDKFIGLCCCGNLKAAKEYLRLHPDINISANKEFAFRAACYRDRLELAKWLLRVKPDINISDNRDTAFRNACYCGHLEVAKWLQTLKPYLYVIEYDENGNYTGFKVRSKEHANWEKRKNALYLTHQEKTNMLYQLPIDIAKTVTLFV